MKNNQKENKGFNFAKNNIKTISFTNQEKDFVKTLKRFFSKKINKFSFLIFVFLLLFLIFSSIFYKYSSTIPVLNSVFAENLPPVYVSEVTQTIEVGDFYNLIKNVEINSDFQLIRESQFAGLVTIVYNPYELIFYSSVLSNNVQININTILGTNSLAIDNFSFFIGSFGISIVVIMLAVLIQFTFGSIIAVYIGYFSKKVFKISYYIISSFGIIPFILLSLIVFNIFGYSHLKAVIIIGVIGIPLFFFSSYSHTLEIKQKEFIKASIASGASSNWVILRIIIPKVMVKNFGLFSENTSISLLVLSSLSFFNISSISNYLNIGNVFRQLIDDFSNYGFSFLVIIVVTLFILTLKVMGVNYYIASHPRIK